MKRAQSAQRRRLHGETCPLTQAPGAANGLELVSDGLEGSLQNKERRLSTEKLNENENKYRVLFEDSAEACWLLDEKGFVDCNPAALAMFGFSTKADFRHPTDFRHPADISPPNQADGTPSQLAAEQRIAAALRNGKDNFEWLHRRKNGDVFPAEVCLAALTLEGRPMLMATVRDITERKRADEALLFRTALMEAQAETTIDGILVVDDSNQIVLMNKQFGRHFGVPEELLSTRDDSLIRKYAADKVENPDAFFEEITHLYNHPEKKSRSEVRLRNGKTFDRYSAPLIDSKGRHRGRTWYFRDITERVKAEVAVRQAEEKYRAIFEDSVVGIFQVTPEGRPTSVNRALAELYGYDSAAELISDVHNMAEQLFVDPGQMVKMARLAAKHDTVRGAEVQVYRKDRTRKWVLMNLRAVGDLKKKKPPN